MIKHENSGLCPRCAEIFDRYPGFHYGMRVWFNSFQNMHPEAHISCAGRNRIEQELLFYKKATRALWMQSAHNWNAAIDVFCEIPQNPDIYDLDWFHNVLAPAVPDWAKWYGEPGSEFYELPHIQVKNWYELSKQGILKLVE